ncbi:EcsC family protein [soil metagenome]
MKTGGSELNGPMGITGADRLELQRAKRLLEKRGLAVRIADAVGTPVEKLLAALPDNAAQMIQAATAKSLNAALRAVVSQMNDAPKPPAQWMHTLAVATTGAVGGAFGLATLAVELPVSTVIMLRSIADIARSEGQSVKRVEVQLACVEVFALGGPSRSDDAAESAYFTVRAALAQTMAEAARHIAERGLAGGAAPALIRLTSQVAARFGIPVTEKVMAQSVPVLGAAGGALINVLFIRHFQDLARGHFIVRRLEAVYGQDAVRAAYLAM